MDKKVPFWQRAKKEIPPSTEPSENGLQAQSAGTGAEPVKVIGVNQIHEALQTLQRYKTGKQNLEQRVIANEQWYKLRHWDYMRTTNTPGQVEPASGWLFNAIASKHADMMDNFPMANILPREQSDQQEAKKLTAIVPVAMEQADFEQVYNDCCESKLRSGTGVYGVFWNSQKLGGLGDIDILEMDIINLFWEPGISDIQKSKNFFSVEMWDNELLERSYPQLNGKLCHGGKLTSEYIYDDAVNTEDKTLVIDWYYKKRVGGRQILHYCKFAGDTVLYSSENDPTMANGWYDHGMYPFVFDPLFRVKGSPCGFGYIDLAKSAQEYIDKSNQAIFQNLLVNAKPRYFIRADGAVNEAEFADMGKDFVHVDGNLGQDSIMPIKGSGLNGNYITVLQNKVDELKEVTGNRDISNGGTTSGVTAASAIAAMQEAGGKLSRDSNKATFRTFRKVVNLVIELIRQFYTLERCFRIQGQTGQEEFMRFSNANIKPQAASMGMGLEDSYRLPLFDIEVSAQKRSAYSKLSQNELAIQFYNAGFFNPQLADQAIACLEMMDFDRKDIVLGKIAENQTLYQMLQQAQAQILQLNQVVDRLTGSNLTGAYQAQLGGGASEGGQMGVNEAGAKALGAEAGEPDGIKKARQRVAESTAPQ